MSTVGGFAIESLRRDDLASGGVTLFDGAGPGWMRPRRGLIVAVVAVGYRRWLWTSVLIVLVGQPKAATIL